MRQEVNSAQAIISMMMGQIADCNQEFQDLKEGKIETTNISNLHSKNSIQKKITKPLEKV